MLIGETVVVAFSSIRANKLRAALTMLGRTSAGGGRAAARDPWTLPV